MEIGIDDSKKVSKKLVENTNLATLYSSLMLETCEESNSIISVNFLNFINFRCKASYFMFFFFNISYFMFVNYNS